MVDLGHIPGKVIIPDCAEVRIRFVLDQQVLAHCVLHGRYVGGFDTVAADCDAALAALIAGPTWTALAAFLCTTGAIAGVDVRNMALADQPYIVSSGVGAAGTSTGTPLPSEMAVCVSFKTAKSGPGNRGRMYFPIWATTALGSGNLVAAAAVTALNNWATTNIGNAMSALTYTHVLAQPKRAEYTGSTGAHHDAREAGTLDVTQKVVLNSTWDSQRRRGLA